MMKPKLMSSLAVVSSLLAAVACAPANPELGPPAEMLSAAEQQAPVKAQVKFQPKVDILFVIDTSFSMDKHIENLAKHIDSFVDAFDVSGGLDFQIGVVSVYDSRRFNVVVPETYPLGKLRPLVGPDSALGATFISRTENFRETLRASLKLEIEKRCEEWVYDPTVKDTVCKKDLGGPEFEELFTPVMAAPEANPDFIRPDAHLAVVMLTDANDASLVQPTELAKFMWDLKGRDKKMVSTYAALVLSPNNLPMGDERRCKEDPSGVPTKIINLVKATDGEMFDLCPYDKNMRKNPDFGTALGQLGKKIQEKASARVRIPLGAVPDLQSLKVSIGGQELQPSQSSGFTYKSGNLFINGNPFPSDDPEATVSIEYIPLAPGKLSNGRVIPVGQ